MRYVKILGLLLVGIALGAGAGAILWHSTADPAVDPAFSPTRRIPPLAPAPAAVIGAPAPDFSLRNLPGESTSLSDFQGRTVLLNFWATWCAPCREELPLLDGIALQHKDSLVVIAVETGETDTEVQSYLEPLGLTSLRILLDPSAEVRDLYLVRGLPTSFLVDPTGIVRWIKIGTVDSSEIESNLSKMGATP
jgi:thiol-disulfide isomerase/thioredoxin